VGLWVVGRYRFPELYQKLRFVHDAEILLMPSAFAVKTGEAHWETLLRARAIECQCYVVASAQVGQHNTDGNKRRSWGHSIVFGPPSIPQHAPRRPARPRPVRPRPVFVKLPGFPLFFVADPWGKKLVDMGGAAEGLATFSVDADLIRQTRGSMPLATHRR
jgi:predicted amidohydrolase